MRLLKQLEFIRVLFRSANARAMSVTSGSPAATALFALTDTLQPIRRSWVQAVMTVLAEFGLPSSLTAAVILASRSGDAGIRQNVLAEEVGVNPGAMVRILDQAEAASSGKRRGRKEDRRVNTVHILPKGQCLAEKMRSEEPRLNSSH